MTEWKDYAKLGNLRAVIDPADEKGHKNRYINLLHHLVLADAIGDSLQGKQILDLGCGNGRFGRFLKECGAEVTGVDSCAEMLEQNVECKTVCAPINNLPFEDNSFDAVLSVWTLQFLSDAELVKSKDEISRILKPGGMVYLIEQVSRHGYDDVFPRLPSDYKNTFSQFQPMRIRGITYNNEKILGMVKRGLIPELAFELIARHHLNYSEHLPIPKSGYLDCLMVFMKGEI